MSTSEQYIVVVEPHFALLRYLQIAQRRYRTLVLTHNPEAMKEAERMYNQDPWVARDRSAIDMLVPYQSVDVASMVRALRPLDGQVAGVVAGDDAFVPLAEQLGYALGFDVARPTDADCHHLKTAMKRRLAERGVRTPAFGIAHDYPSARQIWQRFGGDSMVKMVDLSGSVNIFRSRSERELHDAWDTIVHNRRAIDVPFALATEVIVEEWVSGRELTVEGYIDGDRIEILNYSEKLTEENFSVVGHYIPAAVTAVEDAALSEIARQCVRALGLRNSVFHVEVHVRDGVPYVIECAARPPGLYAVDLIEKCYGHDLMEISIDLAVGQSVNVRRREPRGYFAVLALYSQETGILSAIEGLDELKERGGLMHVTLEVKPGDKIQAIYASGEKFGLVILRDDSADGVRQKAKWLRDNVRVIVAPPERQALRRVATQ
ncbi:MAG: ATP-grasp domain-containing protein [Bradyrhizobiaceae bacterium]|nr:ATP-grasp domain-containing protein [Bradyrhizobiaceae bacterium]